VLLRRGRANPLSLVVRSYVEGQNMPALLMRCVLYHTLLRMGIPGTPFSTGGEVKKIESVVGLALALVLVSVSRRLNFSGEKLEIDCDFTNCLGENPVNTLLKF
jgi:hypothetical protein